MKTWMYGAAAPIAILAGLCLVGCEGERRIIDTFGDSLSADGLDLLDVSVETGNLTVAGDPDATAVDVQVDIATTRTSDKKDSDATHAVHLELRESTGGAALLTVWFDPDYDRYYADTTVTLPIDMAVNGIVEDGDVVIDGAGAVTLDAGAGEADLSDLVGDVEVIDSAGDLSLVGVAGDVLIDDGAGDLSVQEVDGNLEIDDGAGDISVSKVSGDVVIRDTKGEITIDDVGSVTIE